MRKKSLFLMLPLITLVLYSRTTLNVGEASLDTPKIYVDPPSIQIAANQTYFYVNVSIVDITASGLWSYDFYMNWSGPILNVTDVTEGPFLKQGGITYFWCKKYNEPYNYLYVASSLYGTPYHTAYPVGGSGTLVTIRFLVKTMEETALDLYKTKLLGLGMPPSYPEAPIDHRVEDGLVSTEVILPGDVDGDGDVDSADLFTLAAAYGTSSGDTLYDSRCDFDNDGDVDSMDLFTLAANYGKPY